MAQHDEFRITAENPKYENSLVQLNNSERIDLDLKIEQLKNDPTTARQLRSPYHAKYKVVFADKRYRLIISINWTSHSIKLHYVHSRRGYLSKR